MARQPRFRIPGYPQHIVQRGNNRQVCFFEERDYRYYLHCLFDASLVHECEIHAYALMTNHVHILATPSKPDGISKLMQAIGRKYVRMVNARHRRTGTLWEGRYKATLVDTDEYLLACYRYIELNPVRAGLVSEPGNYSWSSFAVHAGDRRDALIRDHSAFLNLGKNALTRTRAYKQLFEVELTDETILEIREATNKSKPLGDGTFQATYGQPTELRRESRTRGGKRIGAGRPKREKPNSSGSDPLD